MAYLKAKPGWRSTDSNDKGNIVNNLTVGCYAHGGLALGSGTSSSYKTTSTAGKNFVSFYFGSSATSGDARGIYNRLYLTGAAGNGESLRSFTTVSDVAAATAHGAHISLSFGTSGSVTGQGAAVRATLHVPTTSTAFGGTVSAGLSEVWFDGTSSTLANTTQHSVHRFCALGSTAATALCLNVWSLEGFGTTNTIKTGTVAGTKKGIRILIDGVVHYIDVGTACT